MSIPYSNHGRWVRHRPSEICENSGTVEAPPSPPPPPSTASSPPSRTTASSSAPRETSLPRSVKDVLKALFGAALYPFNCGSMVELGTVTGFDGEGNVASRFGFGPWFNGAVAGGAWLGEHGFDRKKKIYF